MIRFNKIDHTKKSFSVIIKTHDFALVIMLNQSPCPFITYHFKGQGQKKRELFNNE